MACVIGFDYGERRIGVAVGIMEVGTANPLDTVMVPASGTIPWDPIDKIIQQWQPNKLIVGFVEHRTQNNNRLRNKIKLFCDSLHTHYQLPVEITDESYTSATAYEILKTMRSEGQRKKINKQDIDKASAAVILHAWLASNQEQNITNT